MQLYNAKADGHSLNRHRNGPSSDTVGVKVVQRVANNCRRQAVNV
jgi:hypothetical protein